jgi:multisubunit Na+/H+ antiporter MnhB subunit
LLIVAYAGITLAMTMLWLTAGTPGGVAGILAWIPVFLTLRIAVRTQADLPDAVLDERMRAARDRAYLDAFRLTAGVVFGAACVLFVAVAFRPQPATIAFQYDQASAIFWALFSLIVGAPSLAMAWHESARPTGARRVP